MDQSLIQLINNTNFLSSGDKSFLLERLSELNALEKLKLQQSLAQNEAPSILQSLQLMRAKFFASEKIKEPDLITKVASSIFPKKPKQPISTSILTQPQILGEAPMQAIKEDNIKPLNKLSEFYHPAQLGMLTKEHVNFSLNENADQITQNFLKQLDQIFDKIDSVTVKRSYFMNFIQSSLFGGYITTGLTALRHPELEPAKIVLNLLYQINTNYLNNKQFCQAAIICNHLRVLCGL